MSNRTGGEVNLLKTIKEFYADRFKRYLTIALVVLGVGMLLAPWKGTRMLPTGRLEVHFFYHPACVQCKQQKSFNRELMGRYPSVQFIYHNVTTPEGSTLFVQYAERLGIPLSELVVPATFFGEYHFIGFSSAQTTGKEIERALEAYITGQAATTREKTVPTRVSVPIIGDINVVDYSLPTLAVVLGLADGFNPCAMWALGYLISLVIGMNDRKRIWILVGSFVFASGVLYFLFMTAWLNAFLLIGYVRPLTLIIGLVAIGVGANNIQVYIKTKGALTCDITSTRTKEKTKDRIKRLVTSPITVTTIFGILALAFVVNSIEFACSSAIPAIFTQVLALKQLPALKYYAYILLYDAFFMLDDLIIFGLAAFAVSSTLGTRYAKLNKLVGGAVLLALGLGLTFMPGMLR